MQGLKLRLRGLRRRRLRLVQRGEEERAGTRTAGSGACIVVFVAVVLDRTNQADRAAGENLLTQMECSICLKL